METFSFQREGAVSNTHAGADFESIALRKLGENGVICSPNYAIAIGTDRAKKPHRFDFGGDSPPVLIECKSHTWTSGGNSPSAKLTVWNEAMYYFALSPTAFRKIFFVLKNVHREESLAEHYIRRYGHMIPADVEVWEYCSATDQVLVLLK